MITDLTPEQREKLERALLSAFDLASMQQMLRHKLGYKLEEEMGVTDGFRYVVTRLVDQALDGWLDKLLLKALEYRPGSLKLRQIINELNVQAAEKAEVTVVPVDEDAAETRLEKIVRKQAPLTDFIGFVSRLNSISTRICKIEYPKGYPRGTGWLVDSNLVLTNYHVIEAIHTKQNGLDYVDVHCRFDYNSGINQDRICLLNKDWLVDYAPYSAADLQAINQVPEKTELDYALLRLDENVSSDPLASGELRGSCQVPEYSAVLSPKDLVVIPQHPQGRKLELAFGEIIDYNKPANRVRYDVNTEPGSSGSPCFDINLTPFALHHAQGPNDDLKYNQGIPLRDIIRFMKEKNVTPFWTPRDSGSSLIRPTRKPDPVY